MLKQRSRLSAVACVLFAYASLPLLSGAAKDAGNSKFLLRYRLELSGGPLIFENITCEIDVECEIYRNDERKMRLTVSVDGFRHVRVPTAYVRIECEQSDCFFENHCLYGNYTAAAWITGSFKARLYRGERPRGLEWLRLEALGTLTLQYPDLQRGNGAD